jgi:hypothetical protein
LIVDKDYVGVEAGAEIGSLFGDVPMTSNTAVLDMAPIDPRVLRPRFRSHSSLALPIAAVAATGMFLASRLDMPTLTIGIILLLPLGCLSGYRAMRFMRTKCADSVIGFTINAALLVGAAIPTINEWLKMLS